MSNIKPIKTSRDEWAEKVQEQLVNAMNEATLRPQKTIGIVMVGHDNEVKTFYAIDTITEIVGHIEFLKADLIRASIDHEP